MSIRAEVNDGGQIELAWFDRNGEPRSQRYHTDDTEGAVLVFRSWLIQEAAEEKKGRFITQQQKETKKAFQTLSKRSPYGSKR